MERLTYSILEAGHALGVGKSTIYKLIGEGRLNLLKIGTRSLIRADDLRAVVDAAQPTC